MDFTEFEKQHGNEDIRCPKLGHSVVFNYCKNESVTEPCSRIATCWFGRIDIMNYMINRFGENFVAEFTNRQAKDRMTSIIEIIERAKKRKKSENKTS